MNTCLQACAQNKPGIFLTDGTCEQSSGYERVKRVRIPIALSPRVTRNESVRHQSAVGTFRQAVQYGNNLLARWMRGRVSIKFIIKINAFSEKVPPTKSSIDRLWGTSWSTRRTAPHQNVISSSEACISPLKERLYVELQNMSISQFAHPSLVSFRISGTFYS